VLRFLFVDGMTTKKIVQKVIDEGNVLALTNNCFDYCCILESCDVTFGQFIMTDALSYVAAYFEEAELLSLGSGFQVHLWKLA